MRPFIIDFFYCQNRKRDKVNLFDKYVSNYDMSDTDINYKYYHSYRVMEIMELLAKKLNISEEDIYLAKIIGLFHDIGRFEQDKLYNSFKDDKMDHGEYGVKVLKENKFLDKLNIKKEDYEVIYKSIYNHNKFIIENNLNERELLFAKLIRDADKLDILYAIGNKELKKELRQDTNQITKSLKETFLNNKPGNTKEVKNKNDSLLICFGYIYDINFKETFEIILKEKYYDKIYKRIKCKDIFEPYLIHLKKYIEERMK